jgi:hypothetical protein
LKLKNFSWILRRHPFLYSTRFRLLSQNSTKTEVTEETYNSCNPIDEIPEIYFEINAKIFKDIAITNDLDKAKHIACWLRQHIIGGPGLSLSSDIALVTMLEGNGGVCSDFSQIYNNFCVINNILVKEWGITVIPFDKKYGGHATNEIFSKELNKWILIDVSKCVLFYTHNKQEPLSTLEVFYSNENLKYDAFFAEIKDDTQIRNYYFNAAAAPFLISNYRNKVYDRYLKNFNSRVPIFFIHFFIYLSGNSYKYKFPLDDYRNMFKSTNSTVY